MGRLFPHVNTHCPYTDKRSTCAVLSLQAKKERLKTDEDIAQKFKEQLKITKGYKAE